MDFLLKAAPQLPALALVIYLVARYSRLETMVDEIKGNHLPHVEQRLDRLEKKLDRLLER